MNELKTLKEWRESRGMSIDELSGRTGLPPEQIRRWEEEGIDAFPDTKEDDERLNEALKKVFMVLGVGEEGISGPDYAPSTPRPGNSSLRPRSGHPRGREPRRKRREV